MIVRESTKDPRKTAKEVQQVSGQAAKFVSVRTIQRVLVAGGKLAYRPRKIPALTKPLKNRRVLWSTMVNDMSLDDWKEVSFLKNSF